ncbi:MAG: Crp/Fnr family transcriptional regulator [Pirellulales bacterium]
MNKDSLIETLREIRFLQDIGPMHLEQIAKIARLRDFHDGDVVFRQGDVAQHIYLVVHGNVSLEICAAGSGCKPILTLGPGELLGWSSVLEQLSYTARSRALNTTRLVEINVAQLLAIFDHDPQFGYELMRQVALALAKRLSATRMQFLDVYGEHLPVVHKDEARDAY